MTAPPEWMQRVRPRVDQAPPEWFSRFAPPARPRRHSAVLMLVGRDADGVDDIILTERAANLRSHAGQVSLPGGALDPEDTGPVAAALRESQEEVGVDPTSVEVITELPAVYLSPSGNSVTPVLAWWRRPGPIGVIDEREVARVVRVAVATLLEPANRFTVVAPSGYRGPGFDVHGLFVWGFTAQLLTTLFDLADLTRPWDEERTRHLPERFALPYLRGRA